jgi:hypothetical protein
MGMILVAAFAATTGAFAALTAVGEPDGRGVLAVTDQAPGRVEPSVLKRAFCSSVRLS